MILWREKFRAFGIHFATTLFVAALAAALIFFVWYPPPYATMVGGLKLFVLVTGIDLALGPLLSLVVYDSRKSRRALVFDPRFHDTDALIETVTPGVVDWMQMNTIGAAIQRLVSAAGRSERVRIVPSGRLTWMRAR